MTEDQTAPEFVQALSGFANDMDWLYRQGMSAAELGELFKTTAVNVRQIIWRSGPHRKKNPVHHFLSQPLSTPASVFDPVPVHLRRMLGVRPHEDFVILDRRSKQRLDRLEETVETLGTQFWSGVRYAAGLPALTGLLPLVGYGAHHQRIRILARLRQIIGENHLHFGRAASAINEGLASIHLYRVAHHESDCQTDLESLARTARLVAQAHLLRREPDLALHYLDIHKNAARAAGAQERPEYFRQLAIAALQKEEDYACPENLQTAMQKLRDVTDYGIPTTEHEVRDIGERALNLIRGDWDAGLALLEYMLKCYSPNDIHISLNVAWTAACGFATDDLRIHDQAFELLKRHSDSALGYGRQMSMFRLLELTPRIPLELRRAWARRVLYANALAED